MYQRQILDLCRQGQRLCKTMFTTCAGHPVTNYYLEPSGVHVSEKQAVYFLESGLFVPSGDGLFSAETSQTWQLKKD